MRTRLALVLLAAAVCAVGAEKLKEYKPSAWNLFSPEQDIQVGREGAEEVRRTMPMVTNPELVGYLNRIGARLAKSKRAGNYPYTFEVVNDPNINAFALPGGPMFVHTGLVAAADNESQIAGVLAHEISHVALRHGTANVTKANLIQLPAMLAGGWLSSKGAIWGMLGQLGAGLGAESLLLKYSRDAEKNADLNGAQMMNDAGYDPTEMARFFEKLGADNGKDSKLANFLASHPSPGNRVKYVSEQNKLLPKVAYSELEPGALPRMKNIIANLPPPPKPLPQAGGGGQGPQPGQGGAPSGDVRPSGRFRTHRGPDFELSYPDNWELFGDPNSHSVTIAPRATLVQDQQGNVHVGYGMIVALYIPKDGKPNLKRDTTELLRQILAANPQMRQTANPKSVKVGGRNALLTALESPSPYQNMREHDMILTVALRESVFYTIFIAPEQEWNGVQPAFDQVVASMKFAQ